jgi:arsenate reductase (thioredoxin)
VRNALVLCTGNSARSILGEALIAHHGKGQWRAFSAGSKPTGRVNPYALATLARHRVPAPADARSKSWDEFSRPSAPQMDLVVTVCDSAANEPCPAWPGAPLRAHWGLEDPAAAQDDAALTAAFETAFQTIDRRVRAFMALELEKVPTEQLHAELKRIGSLS